MRGEVRGCDDDRVGGVDMASLAWLDGCARFGPTSQPASGVRAWMTLIAPSSLCRARGGREACRCAGPAAHHSLHCDRPSARPPPPLFLVSNQIDIGRAMPTVGGVPNPP